MSTEHDSLLWLAFERAALTHAGAAAYVDSHRSVSYERLHEEATAHAARLSSALDGGGQGTVVALISVDPVATLAWMLGALSTGASVGLVAPDGADQAAQLQLLRPDLTVTCTDAGSEIAPQVPEPRAPLPPGLVVCTAGTTGVPKAVVHSHTTLGHAVRRLELFRLESAGTPGRVPRDARQLADGLLEAAAAPALGLHYATTLPLTTMAGLTVAFQALLAGESMALLSASDPTMLLEELTTTGVTNISLTPLLAQLVLRAARRNPSRLDRLFLVGIGGGPVPPQLPEELEVAIGCPVAVGYGTTEVGGAITMGRLSDTAEVRHRTVGRALPGVELTVDARTQELSVHCASTALGYITPAGALLELDRGTCLTGDLARIRPDGAVEMRGRADALILRGGRNIDPVRIEHTLENHPAVRRAAAFGVSNLLVSGEQDIWTAVVLDHRVDETELRAHCNRSLGAALTPRRVIEVDSLPLTPDGAVRRHDLVHLAESRSPVITRRS